MAEIRRQFHWADYLVFSLSLAMSILIGIIFAVRDKWHKQSAESYLMADRQMNWVLVALSFIATTISGNFFIGITTEFYYYGMTFLWSAVGQFLGGLFTVFIVIPKFFRLGTQLTSAYEYFELRFNLPVRMVVGLIFCVTQLLSMAVRLYTPSLVLSAVTPLSIEWSIALGAIVCMVYTSFGGMKAVIWVDSIQIIIMIIGMCVMAGRGVLVAGGINKVWETYAGLGERDNWDDLSPAPWNRNTVWNNIFLLGLFFSGMYGTNQSVLQRYMTVPSMRRAQWSVLLGVILTVTFYGMVLFIGMAAFTTLGGNERLLSNPDRTKKADQILAVYLMYLLGDFPGLPGLVVAAIYAAGLSTLSSGQNAMAAVITKDFIETLYLKCTKRKMSEKATNIISKISDLRTFTTLGIAVGLSTLALSLGVPYFSDTVVTLTLSVESFLYGPLLGLLLAGFFFYWVESWGGLAGLLCSLGWALLIFFGQVFELPPSVQRIGQEFMPWFNQNFSKKVEFPDPGYEPTLFDISYTWFVPLDMVVVLIIASIVSLVVRCCVFKGCRWTRKEIQKSEELRYTMYDLRAAVSNEQRQMPDSTALTTQNNHHGDVDDKPEKNGADNMAFTGI